MYIYGDVYMYMHVYSSAHHISINTTVLHLLNEVNNKYLLCIPWMTFGEL